MPGSPYHFSFCHHDCLAVSAGQTPRQIELLITASWFACAGRLRGNRFRDRLAQPDAASSAEGASAAVRMVLVLISIDYWSVLGRAAVVGDHPDQAVIEFSLL